MRIIAIAIPTAALLLFTAFPLCFAQQTSSNFFVGISRDTIDPGERVPVRISVILEPNSTIDAMVRFVPPQGSVQQLQLHLRADSLGFASETVDYPNGVATASTQQPGNYTVFVQDVQTGTLVERASFEVVEPAESGGFPDFISLLLFPVIAGAVGTVLTYFYNYRAQKRETKVTLNQKKAEIFLELDPIYTDIVDAAWSVAENLGIRNVDPKKMEKVCKYSFYNLIRYFRGYNALVEKFGGYFLSDPRGEELLRKVAANIRTRIRDRLDFVDDVAFGQMLSEGQTFVDLENELSLSSTESYQFYEKFKSWINDNQKSKEIQEFIRDLKLLHYLVRYEVEKMFEDWYPKKEGVDQLLRELRWNIHCIYRQDNRYRSETYP